jgi:Cysteine-rich CWC
MQKHEEKICAKCDVAFECKVVDIANCECSQIKLSDVAQLFLAENFSDCLCLNCLKAIVEKTI